MANFTVGLGIPPIWNRPRFPPHLKPDSGVRYIDQNADRNPWSPLEPLIRAVSTMHPSFDFNTMDVITDRRPLRKLYGFVKGEEDDFEFGVEVIGNTALLARMERQTRETIPPGTFQGYRQAFEEAYTKVSVSAKSSTSHHRICQYKFGGLNFLVRCAFDAYLEELMTNSTSPDTEQGHKSVDLVGYLKATSLESAAPSTVERHEAPGVKVVEGGQIIPHAALLEMETVFKFSKRSFDIERRMPDFWLSQTLNFILASHQNVGTKWSRAQHGQPRLAEFVDVDIKDMRQELAEWEETNEKMLSRLLTVLKIVIETAKGKNAPCIVRYNKGVLSVSNAEKDKVPSLPEDLCQKWSVVSKSA